MRRRSITVAIFPTISPPSHVFSPCKCARKDKGGERAPITCLSQDDSSGCGKALHPSIRPLAFTFPHPISACHLFPSEGKNRTAGRGNYRTARRSGGESILSLLSPKKHFLGSPVVAQSLSPSPPPPPRPVQSRRSMGRCEGCFVRVCLSGVVRSMTHPPLPTYPPSHPLHPMPSVLKGLRSTFAIS